MIPQGVIEIRREICEREKCSKRKRLNFDDPCVACPNGHWGQYSPEGCEGVKLKLGSRIARFAKPIARSIDKLARGKTKLATCGGCKQMESDLNAGMPIIKAIERRFKKKR